MKNINWLPRLKKIVIEQHYHDGRISPTITTTVQHSYIGYQYYKWLWFEFKMKFNKFEVWNSRLEFKKAPPKGVEVEVLYFNEI